MKITKEIKERIDKNGNLIDFTYCFKCYHFIDISSYNIDDEIKCSYCNTDEYLEINDKRYPLYLSD